MSEKGSNRQQDHGHSRSNEDTQGENRVGAYRILRSIGAGSFSKVRLGIHEATNKYVAIKIVNRTQMKQMSMTEKVRLYLQHLDSILSSSVRLRE